MLSTNQQPGTRDILFEDTSGLRLVVFGPKESEEGGLLRVKLTQLSNKANPVYHLTLNLWREGRVPEIMQTGSFSLGRLLEAIAEEGGGVRGLSFEISEGVYTIKVEPRSGQHDITIVLPEATYYRRPEVTH